MVDDLPNAAYSMKNVGASERLSPPRGGGDEDARRVRDLAVDVHPQVADLAPSALGGAEGAEDRPRGKDFVPTLRPLTARVPAGHPFRVMPCVLHGLEPLAADHRLDGIVETNRRV